MLSRTDRDAVAYLEMNSPRNLNALSDAMLDALIAELAQLAEDRSIRAVVISGVGAAFCAGHDLKEVAAARQDADGGKAAYDALFAKCSQMMLAIQALPQVVIAQVHGIATAAGCQLVANCDLAVADSKTRFGVNGVDIGLFCSTPMVAVSRNIPRKQVFEMLVTGGFLDAEQALELGLINRVAAPEALPEVAEALAQQVAGKLGSAVALGKKAFYEQIQMPVDEALRHTSEAIVANLMDPDTQEGIAAFLEKRPPDWPQ